MKYMEKPYTYEEVVEMVKENDGEPYIMGVVFVNLNEIVDKGLESFLNMLSERMIGTHDLKDTTYRTVGTYWGLIMIEVSASVENYLKNHQQN